MFSYAEEQIELLTDTGCKIPGYLPGRESPVVDGDQTQLALPLLIAGYLVAKHEGEVLSIEHPTTTLEELFLSIVRESEARPGRRAAAAGEADAAPAAN